MRKEWYIIVGLLVYFLFVQEPQIAPSEEASVVPLYMVEIKGEVVQPGVYSVGVDARVFDVIELAKGFTDEADTSKIILSQRLQDGQVIDVKAYSTIDSTLIDINNASMSELLALPGFGPAKAQDVIDYRIANGPFSTIDGIKNVKGIGDSTFAAIQEFIRAG